VRALLALPPGRFGLDQAIDAYDPLDAGELEGRAVIVP
jgi:hypothetical protein